MEWGGTRGEELGGTVGESHGFTVSVKPWLLPAADPPHSSPRVLPSFPASQPRRSGQNERAPGHSMANGRASAPIPKSRQPYGHATESRGCEVDRTGEPVPAEVTDELAASLSRHPVDGPMCGHIGEIRGGYGQLEMSRGEESSAGPGSRAMHRSVGGGR